MEWSGSVAQAVKCLLCKCKAPSSNPSPTKTTTIKKPPQFQLGGISSRALVYNMVTTVNKMYCILKKC
jgi:hypothetical protein